MLCECYRLQHECASYSAIPLQNTWEQCCLSDIQTTCFQSYSVNDVLHQTYYKKIMLCLSKYILLVIIQQLLQGRVRRRLRKREKMFAVMCVDWWSWFDTLWFECFFFSSTCTPANCRDNKLEVNQPDFADPLNSIDAFFCSVIWVYNST